MNRILEQKRIDTLYHFTRTENLENIFRYGLIPRDVLDTRRIRSSYNDEYRYDDCLNAVCTSIEFPNYKMFYKLRQDNPETDWVVLKLDANILCDYECAYCWTNAGDASIYTVPIEERMGTDAFLELFDDREGYPKREDLHINDWYPTNPQAEVLVFGTISTDYISAVYFENHRDRNKYIDLIPIDISARVDSKVFCPRNDWQAWRN